MNALETAAIVAWKIWADGWSMVTACFHCGEIKSCRGRRRRRMLCLDCFDQGKR